MSAGTIIDQFLAGWSNDMASLLQLFSDDIVYIDKPLQADLKGKGDVEKFAKAFFTAFPDIRFELASAPILSTDHAAFEWRVTGRHKGQLNSIPASNKTIDFMGVSIMEFRAGKIVRTVDYWDLTTLLRQIGQAPG
jgi:steroid delta-isomerase-like uncharacterized protein